MNQTDRSVNSTNSNADLTLIDLSDQILRPDNFAIETIAVLPTRTRSRLTFYDRRVEEIRDTRIAENLIVVKTAHR